MTRKFWLIAGGITAVAAAGIFAVGKIRKNAVAELKRKVEPTPEPETEAERRSRENSEDPELQAELHAEAQEN